MEEKKEQKSYFWVFGVFLWIVIIMFIILHNTSSSTSFVVGKAISIEAISTEQGTHTVLQIKLETGRIVRVSIGPSFQFKKGSEVQLQETKTIIGTRSYTFIKNI